MTHVTCIESYRRKIYSNNNGNNYNNSSNCTNTNNILNSCDNKSNNHQLTKQQQRKKEEEEDKRERENHNNLRVEYKSFTSFANKKSFFELLSPEEGAEVVATTKTTTITSVSAKTKLKAAKTSLKPSSLSLASAPSSSATTTRTAKTITTTTTESQATSSVVEEESRTMQQQQQQEQQHRIHCIRRSTTDSSIQYNNKNDTQPATTTREITTAAANEASLSSPPQAINHQQNPNPISTPPQSTELLRCNMVKIASNFLAAIISSATETITAISSAATTTNNNNNNITIIRNNKNLTSIKNISEENQLQQEQQQQQQFISVISRRKALQQPPRSPRRNRPEDRHHQDLHRHHHQQQQRQRQHHYRHRSPFDCLFAAAVFSLMFLMVEKLHIVSATSNLIAKHEPMFISRSETFKFVSGETIVLPCEVANTDPFVVAWKRGIAILTAGSVKVTPDPRVRLVNGFNLQIRDAVPQDAGDYICQIATMEPREITHTVEILVPPRIHHISTGGHLQVKKGSSVRIECSASGNPTPNVTWSRKNNILPNGEEKLHSHILSIENVDRHKGGVYICTANNGVGQAASSQVVLHVLYPPEISVERPIVFSGEGHEAMLVCIVHGETQPEVIWFKDTMQLDTTERHIMETRGSRHTLIIRKVHPQDFGNYSCVAENQLGKSRKTLQLSGKPNVAVFNSPPISQYKDRYNISWTVDSHTPIEEYKLSFRRMPQGHELDTKTIDHLASSSSSSSSSSTSTLLQMYGGGSGSSSSYNNHNYRMNGIGLSGNGGGGVYGNALHWGRNDWRDVVLPAMPLSHHYTQGMSYMIRGLDPDQHYEATVQARNRYGWSELTHSFVFSTSSNDGLIDLTTFLNHGLSDNEMRDLSVTFYGSSTDVLTPQSPALIGLTLILAKLSNILVDFIWN